MKKHKLISLCIYTLFLAYPIFTYASETAIFAGGCFWTMQYNFDQLPGVVKTTVGYTGGSLANPSYEQVSRGDTGHYEAIQVDYDPAKISYPQLLNFYWHNIDPTNAKGQFCDTGSEYRSVIFFSDAKQEKMAKDSRQKIADAKTFPQIETQILPAQAFYPAENYHQKFYLKSPVRFNSYEYFCGRPAQLKALWGNPSSP